MHFIANKNTNRRKCSRAYCRLTTYYFRCVIFDSSIQFWNIKSLYSDRSITISSIKSVCSNRGIQFSSTKSVCSDRGIQFSSTKYVCSDRGIQFSSAKYVCCNRRIQNLYNKSVCLDKNASLSSQKLLFTQIRCQFELYLIFSHGIIILPNTNLDAIVNIFVRFI